MEIKERIIAKAREQFFRYGVKSVTMDDIVHQLMMAEMANDKCEWNDLDGSSNNVIEKIVKSMDIIRKAFAEINPSAFFDIKKYHPKTWQLFQDHKQNFVMDSIRKELLQGIEEGFFRADIKVEILVRMRLEQIEIGFDPHLFPPNKFSLIEVELTLLDHYIRGILTPKGLEVYQEFMHNALNSKN